MALTLLSKSGVLVTAPAADARRTMSDEFTVDPTVCDLEERARLLASAADLLDRRTVLLGPGAKRAATPEGELVRMFAEDRATLGRPEVFRLARDGLDAQRDGVPVTLEEFTRRYEHFWLALPVALWTRAGRGFNRLEVRLGFNPDEAEDARRPTVVDALPNHDLVTRFRASAQVSLAVGADFRLAPALPDLPLAPVGVPATLAANADTHVAGEGKLLLGPFQYALKTPRVTRSGLGLDHVFWRLDRDSFMEENDPGIRVILRLPRPAERLQVTAEMVATRFHNLLGEGLRQAILDLPAALRDFFTRGTPIAATAQWDLREEL